MSARLMILVLVVASLAGGCGPRGTISPSEPSAPVQAKDDPLLGEWVSDGNDNPTHIVFKKAGRAEVREEGKTAEQLYFQREPIASWAKHMGDDTSKHAVADTFGRDAVVVYLGKEAAKVETHPQSILFFYSDQQILVIPMEELFVRPGNEKKHSKRMDAGDGSRAPFEFVHGATPIFADQATADWAYSFKGDWRTLLPKAAAELRAAGFDGPPVEKEPAGLAGETGSVFYYRTMDTEHVILVPNLRSAWQRGKWVTSPAKGWVTVHVNIKTAAQRASK